MWCLCLGSVKNLRLIDPEDERGCYVSMSLLGHLLVGSLQKKPYYMSLLGWLLFFGLGSGINSKHHLDLKLGWPEFLNLQQWNLKMNHTGGGCLACEFAVLA